MIKLFCSFHVKSRLITYAHAKMWSWLRFSSSSHRHAGLCGLLNLGRGLDLKTRSSRFVGLLLGRAGSAKVSHNWRGPLVLERRKLTSTHNVVGLRGGSGLTLVRPQPWFPDHKAPAPGHLTFPFRFFCCMQAILFYPLHPAAFCPSTYRVSK